MTAQMHPMPPMPPSPEPPLPEQMFDQMRETIETQARTIRYLLANYQGLLDKIESEEHDGDHGGGGGVDFTTTEQDTELKWIDGKKIYQKSIDLNVTTWVAGPNGQGTQMPHGITGLDTLVEMIFSVSQTIAMWDGTNNNLVWITWCGPASGQQWSAFFGQVQAADATNIYVSASPGQMPPSIWQDASSVSPPTTGTFKKAIAFATLRYTKT